jgi:amidohydrolase
MRGADLMIRAGILKDPEVDAALALHVMPDAPPGVLSYNRGALFASSDNFVINIKGKGTHGAAPHLGVDPINVGAHIYLAFQELIARESPFLEPAVLTIGEFKAGSAFNILPEECLLRGSLRTYSGELRDFLVRRMEECAGDIARAYRAELRFEIATSLPPTFNNPELTDELLEHIGDLGFHFNKNPNYLVTGSEDFSLIGRIVPSCMLLLGAGQKDNPYFLHNPKLVLDEAALPLGAAIMAQCAFGWLTR